MKATKAVPGADAESAPAPTNGDDLKAAVDWVLNDHIFAGMRLHGNVKWRPVALVRLALFWMWSYETGLVGAAKAAIKQVLKLFGTVAVGSYQALTGALNTYTPQLLNRLWARLHNLFQTHGGTAWRVGKWLPLGVDGSRVSVPRTEPNEQQFCKPNTPKKANTNTKKANTKKANTKKANTKKANTKKANAKKTNAKKTKKANKTYTHARQRSRHAHRPRSNQRRKSHYNPQPVGPQLWLTLIWHIGLRLPWCWELGPSYDSERSHLLALLDEQLFPERTLFCGDAGFYGYEFWRGIRDCGHHFLVRVGSNVRLLKDLGVVRQHGDWVYCWPNEQMKKHQPPLVLRLFRFHDGRNEVFLVSSVLDEQELSVQQAGQIYRGRWGIEVQFRALKQTYGRSKLRSRTPEHATLELHWSLVGLTVLQLLALKEQRRPDEPVPRTSIAAVLQIIRAMIAECSQPRATPDALPQRLAGATTDSYQRHGTKKSRNYPRRKEEPSAGAPIITTATPEHQKALQLLGEFDLAG
jgi:hypothetical protein